MPSHGTPRGPGRPYGGAPTEAGARRRRRWIASLLVVASAIAAWFAVGLALWDNTETVAGNTFDASGCFQPRLRGVQTGEVTVTGAGDTDVPITAVDPSLAFVLSTQRSDDGQPADQAVAVRLVSSNTVRITKAASSSHTDIVVRWSVVEYVCGIDVQRGTIAPGSSSPATITAVDPTHAFVLHTHVPAADSTEVGDNDLHSMWVASPTELAFGGDLLDTTLAYQVVEFQPGAASVQQATIDLTSTGTATAALSTPVDPDRTLVLAGWSTPRYSPGLPVASAGVRTRLLDSSTVEASRTATEDSVVVRAQVVELADGTVVRHGIADLVAGELTAGASFDSVTVARSTMISTGQASAGQSLGRGDRPSGDRLGEVSFTMEVASPVSATLTRDSALDDASVAWQVVEWTGPPWWDTDWDFRRRIDVDVTVLAEERYSVPVTIDHATMAADGFSLVSGDDVRVLRWDGTTWTELDRILDEAATWNDGATTFWFRTTDDVAAGGSASYWLYHGNDVAGVPPTDPDNVWLARETFDDGSLGDLVDRTPGAWYQADPWTRRRSLSVPAASVPSDLTDFPLLVQLTDADLAANAQADGDDIRFVAADGTTPLDHEIERWDVATGSLTAWVRIPNLSSSTDTTLYLLYGAPNSPDQSDVDSLWGDALAVWHLAEDPSAEMPQADDSGPDDREAVSTGSMTSADRVPAVAGRGLDLDGVDDRLTSPTFDVSSGPVTVSAWFRPDTLTTESVIVAKATGTGDPVFELAMVDDGGGGRELRGRLDVGGAVTTVRGGALSAATWHHAALVYDTTTVRLVLDGVEVDSTAATGVVLSGSGRPVTVGGLDDGTWAFEGLLDEVRIETAARSVDRLSVERDNQSAPDTFLTVGAVETGTWLAQGQWSHRIPVAVDGSAVVATLTDRPVPVRIASDADLAALAQADGADIVVTDRDAVTRLDHEIERFDAVTGELVVWVRVPQLDAGEDELLYLYVGNPTAVDQQDPEGVFGAATDAVWHLDAVG